MCDVFKKKKNVFGRLRNTFLAFIDHFKGRCVELTIQHFWTFFELARPVHPHSTTYNALLVSKLCLNYYVKKNIIKYWTFYLILVTIIYIKYLRKCIRKWQSCDISILFVNWINVYIIEYYTYTQSKKWQSYLRFIWFANYYVWLCEFLIFRL